jgi:hypothetical protein
MTSRKAGFFTSWHSSGKVVTVCFESPNSLNGAITPSLTTTEPVLALTDSFAFHSVWSKRQVALFVAAP